MRKLKPTLVQSITSVCLGWQRYVAVALPHIPLRTSTNSCSKARMITNLALCCASQSLPPLQLTIPITHLSQPIPRTLFSFPIIAAQTYNTITFSPKFLHQPSEWPESEGQEALRYEQRTHFYLALFLQGVKVCVPARCCFLCEPATPMQGVLARSTRRLAYTRSGATLPASSIARRTLTKGSSASPAMKKMPMLSSATR